MKLIYKFFLGAFFIASLVLVAAYIGKQTLHDMRVNYDKVEVETLPVIHVLEDVRFFGLQLASLLSEVSLLEVENQKEHITSDMNHEYELMRDAAEKLKQSLQHYETLLLPEEQPKSMALIHKHADLLIQNTDALMQLQSANERVKFVVSITNQTQRAKKAFLYEVSKALQKQQNIFVNRKLHLEKDMDKAKRDLTMLALLGLIALVIALVYLYMIFLRPVLALTEMMAKITAGDFSSRAYVH